MEKGDYKMLDFFIVKKTKAIPYAVYGGKVESFKMNNSSTMTFDGSSLKISQKDGFVYAVFVDKSHADIYSLDFTVEGCVQSNFDGYMNAYCISH
jgi:hypothetical protein